MVVLPWVRSLNDGSMARTSGSLKYTDGWVKSRGGDVVVVGGWTGPAGPVPGGTCCALATPGVMAATPASATSPRRTTRRGTRGRLRRIWLSCITITLAFHEDQSGPLSHAGRFWRATSAHRAHKPTTPSCPRNLSPTTHE